eukprot:bmy_20170T0
MSSDAEESALTGVPGPARGRGCPRRSLRPPEAPHVLLPPPGASASHSHSPPRQPEINSTSARVLLFLVVPGHLIFFSIIYLVEGQSVPNDKTFVGLYLLAGLIQVTILLYLAEATVRLTWNQALDPDDHCIPYLTGLGDLLGTGLLALCFLAHWLLRSETGLDGTSEPASGPS